MERQFQCQNTTANPICTSLRDTNFYGNPSAVCALTFYFWKEKCFQPSLCGGASYSYGKALALSLENLENIPTVLSLQISKLKQHRSSYFLMCSSRVEGKGKFESCLFHMLAGVCGHPMMKDRGELWSRISMQVEQCLHSQTSFSLLFSGAVWDTCVISGPCLLSSCRLSLRPDLCSEL